MRVHARTTFYVLDSKLFRVSFHSHALVRCEWAHDRKDYTEL